MPFTELYEEQIVRESDGGRLAVATRSMSEGEEFGVPYLADPVPPDAEGGVYAFLYFTVVCGDAGSGED